MAPRLYRSLFAFLLLALPGSGRADPAKLWSFKADKGFVDEPMAFSADDSRFAYIHTDAAEFAKVVVLRTDSLKPEKELKLEDPSRVARQLAFTPDGTRLVLVWADGHSGAQSAAIYDLESGKLVGKKLGPATSAAITTCGDEQCLALTTSKTTPQGVATHSVTAFRTKDAKRLGAGTATVQADQTLKSPPVRLLYFEPGNLVLVGSEKGKFDKKRDIRLPDRVVRWSLLTRKELPAEQPKELLEWTKAINMRPNHPGQQRFVQVSEDLKQLLLVGQDNAIAKVSVPVTWKLYEPKSLIQTESWDGKALLFSLTIDPVNPDAVRRKKADKERLDLYRITDGTKVSPLGRVDTGKRGFLWVVGSRHFSYLRRLKGFGRGGSEVELHKIEK
jgi:hypothetical protein